MGVGCGDLRYRGSALDNLAVADVDEGVPGPGLGRVPDKLAEYPGTVAHPVAARTDCRPVSSSVGPEFRRQHWRCGSCGYRCPWLFRHRFDAPSDGAARLPRVIIITRGRLLAGLPRTIGAPDPARRRRGVARAVVREDAAAT